MKKNILTLLLFFSITSFIITIKGSHTLSFDSVDIVRIEKQAKSWSANLKNLNMQDQQLIGNALYFCADLSEKELTKRKFSYFIKVMIQNIKNQEKPVSYALGTKTIASFIKTHENYNKSYLRWKSCMTHIDTNKQTELFNNLFEQNKTETKNEITLFLKENNEKINVMAVEIGQNICQKYKETSSELQTLLYLSGDELPVDINEENKLVTKIYILGNISIFIDKQMTEAKETVQPLISIQENLQKIGGILFEIYYKQIIKVMNELSVPEKYKQIMFDQNGLIPEKNRKKLLPLL